MNRDVIFWASACVPCQKAKVTRHTKSLLQKFKSPDQRFDIVHIDIVGPLPVSSGYKYLFTCVDRFTRWPEAIPMVDMTAESVARAFMIGWIARFGVPSVIVTDQGRQFESALWTDMRRLLGIQRQRTTAYHAQANGMVERLHRQLKASLRAHACFPDWMVALPVVLLGIRCAHKQDLDCGACDLVYGTTLRLPGEILSPSNYFKNPDDPAAYATKLKRAMSRISPTESRQPLNRSTFVHKSLDSCKYVFVRRLAVHHSLTCPYDGPFKVLDRASKTFTLLIKNRSEKISIDRLKPAFMENDNVREEIIRQPTIDLDYPQPAPPVEAPVLPRVPDPQLVPPVVPEIIVAPEIPAAEAEPVVTTRSGRVSRPPERFCCNNAIFEGWWMSMSME